MIKHINSLRQQFNDTDQWVKALVDYFEKNEGKSTPMPLTAVNLAIYKSVCCWNHIISQDSDTSLMVSKHNDGTTSMFVFTSNYPYLIKLETQALRALGVLAQDQQCKSTQVENRAGGTDSIEAKSGATPQSDDGNIELSQSYG